MESEVRNPHGMQAIEYARKVITEPAHAFEKRMKKAANAMDQSTAVYRLLEEAAVPEARAVKPRRSGCRAS